jgi:hypothetical protein
VFADADSTISTEGSGSLLVESVQERITRKSRVQVGGFWRGGELL